MNDVVLYFLGGPLDMNKRVEQNEHRLESVIFTWAPPQPVRIRDERDRRCMDRPVKHYYEVRPAYGEDEQGRRMYIAVYRGLD